MTEDEERHADEVNIAFQMGAEWQKKQSDSAWKGIHEGAVLAMQGRIAELEAVLRKIAECDVPREHVKIYRKDGVLSKHDRCEHGRPMYEDCDICTADFARKALEKKDG